MAAHCGSECLSTRGQDRRPENGRFSLSPTLAGPDFFHDGQHRSGEGDMGEMERVREAAESAAGGRGGWTGRKTGQKRGGGGEGEEPGETRAAQQQGGGGRGGEGERWGEEEQEAEVFRAEGLPIAPDGAAAVGGVGPAQHSHNACWAPAASARPAPSPPRCCAAAAWPLLHGAKRRCGVRGMREAERNP